MVLTKRTIVVLASLPLFALAACSSSSDDGKGGTPQSPGGSSSSSTTQTCTEHHNCINGSCSCTDGPNKDKSCCDPDDTTCNAGPSNCTQFCRVCTSS